MRKLQNSELNRISVDEFKNCQKIPVVVVLDNIRSQHNIGSVFRTSDAFLIDKIYLCGITATPPNNEIHKSALGAENTVSWEYHADTISIASELKQQGYQLIAIEQVSNSVFLQEFQPDPTQRYALIFGNEVKGVDQAVIDVCNGSIEIPQGGTKHSLNISVSVGVVLWDFYQKLRLAQ